MSRKSALVLVTVFLVSSSLLTIPAVGQPTTTTTELPTESTTTIDQSTISIPATSNPTTPEPEVVTSSTVSTTPAALPTTAGPPADLMPRPPSPKPPISPATPEAANRRLQVKFQEGSGIRLRNNGFTSQTGADLSELEAVLAKHPAITIERLFERPESTLTDEKSRVEARSRRQQADKNLYYRLILSADTNGAAVLRDLNTLAIVETAYAEPLPAPPPITPSFVNQQDYREGAPLGIEADFASSVPGGRGQNVKIIDVEYSWNQNHEDLSKGRLSGALIANGTPNDPFFDDNHGTAVIGELVADSNGLGVTGLADQAALGMVNVANEDGYDLADAIDLAHANLSIGDVILIEQQVGRFPGDDRYIPVEWVPSFYDAIVSAASDGIIVVEAAGNGGQNLDDSYFGPSFPLGQPDSGAIIVGAGAAPCDTPQPTRSRLDFSTYGSRVNVQGWGHCVVTTGYGWLQGGDRNQWYTGDFRGTSSASPIVAAAAAVLSSVAEQGGRTLSPQQVRSLLQSTGTPQDTSVAAYSGHIGPLPNLQAAIAQLGTVSTIIAYPTSTKILIGSKGNGSFSRLGADDNSYYEVKAGGKKNKPVTDWYGQFTNISNSLGDLKITYQSKNSRSCTQTIAIWRWTTSSWITLDSRSVGTGEVSVANLAPTGDLADYVSGSTGNGNLQVKVSCKGPSKSFTASGDLMRITYASS